MAKDKTIRLKDPGAVAVIRTALANGPRRSRTRKQETSALPRVSAQAPTNMPNARPENRRVKPKGEWKHTPPSDPGYEKQPTFSDRLRSNQVAGRNKNTGKAVTAKQAGKALASAGRAVAKVVTRGSKPKPKPTNNAKILRDNAIPQSARPERSKPSGGPPMPPSTVEARAAAQKTVRKAAESVAGAVKPAVSRAKTVAGATADRVGAMVGKAAGAVKSAAKTYAANQPVASKKTGGGDYPTYKKDSNMAGNFRSAFAAARKAGKSTFTWNGRKYNTKVK